MSHMVICAGKQRREHEVLELFALVNKCEKALLFDFQQAPKRLRFIGDSMAMFGMELKPFYGEAVYDIYNYVHKADCIGLLMVRKMTLMQRSVSGMSMTSMHGIVSQVL